MDSQVKPKLPFGLKETHPGAPYILQLAKFGSVFQGYYKNFQGLTVVVSVDNGFVHISVSRPDRYPTWDEIKGVKYALYPMIEMAMYFPAAENFVNLHENCFHLFETKKGEHLE